ncbi:hypothetical protein PGT21_028247 [Puccinia graminis f. sp. tritici]|uniref:Uncharacterized protein n=2 Tax=Puccinia graminis f. sp. tritici TaxID=56615 RepID=E3K233_PUCGT|nr:uncharacterized protein PGTG_04358 [Puccinia graminis f. sp. tritici CRL 75-36-700-3]EFP78402.2 hypothetical protein PGTG_04358 [Puccinia graminis f. sp. tritici CRL 75-36-700-3]KAA1119534.1 hypothetical protein PGT21_028247 [Puccinia graminis f. sp. tritici]KAA1120775.1 hypothetical protein PGTUg99_014431 [Puccinia graminis f. sp. tritici]
MFFFSLLVIISSGIVPALSAPPAYTSKGAVDCSPRFNQYETTDIASASYDKTGDLRHSVCSPEPHDIDPDSGHRKGGDQAHIGFDRSIARTEPKDLSALGAGDQVITNYDDIAKLDHHPKKLSWDLLKQLTKETIPRIVLVNFVVALIAKWHDRY